MKRALSLCALIASFITSAATLQAQNVAVDKSSLTFSAQFGGSAVSQTLTVSSTGSAITFFTFSNQAWVKVNGQSSASGSTPASVTVSADPTGLNPGTYSASLSVFGGANSVPVAITLTVSNVGVSPSSIAFTGYTAGSTAIPAPQTINLTGTASAFTTAATTASGGNWLQVTPAAGTSPGSIAAVLNTVVLPGLAVGTYQGKITVTPGGGATNTPVDIPVTLTVSSAPVIAVTPSPLQFSVQTGGTNNITTQAFTVTAAPAAQLSYGFTATVDPNPAGRNWITINPPAGNTDPATGVAHITIGVDPTNLPANTYNGKITLFTPGGSPAQQDIAVKLVVSSSPLLNVPTTELAFSYQLAGAVPAAQNVNVTATSGSLNYTIAASANAPWLTVPATGTTAAPFAVSVNPAGMAPGSYTGTITVTGTTADSGAQQIPVTLKVGNDPAIVTNLGAFTFPYQIGQATPPSQLLKITSSTGALLNYTATTAQTTCTGSNWLTLNGSASAPATGSTDASLVLSANPAGLPAGACTGSITIAATVASSGVAALNSPLTIPVTLYVSSTPLLVTTPQTPPSFSIAQGAQSVAPQSIVLSSTNPADPLNWSATFQTTSGGNWLFAAPLSGSTGASNNALTISAIPALLSAGTYTGTVTITATGANNAPVANSPITMPVTLTVTSGSLTLSAASLTFTETAGGSAPAPQTITVGSNGQPLTYTVVTATSVNPSWLSVTPAGGTTSANGTLTVSVDGSKLTAGTYSGAVTVSSPGAGNSPAVVNVTLTVQAGTIAASPASLTFIQAAGGTAPAAQTIAVTGTPGTLNFTAAAAAGAAWLSVTPASGVTPGTASVSVNAGSMPVGQYTGNVTIASTGAAGSPITIPVTLNVVAPLTLSAAPASLAFTYAVGQTAPASQSLVVNSGGSAPISAAVQFTGPSAWLQVAPTSTTVPATLTVTVTPGTLPPATYNATITITSPSSLAALTVPVTFTVVQIPKPVVNSVGNAANYLTGSISPGENIVIFGTGVGPAAIASGTVANNAWGTMAGSTRVLFDGVAAPILYASDKQTSVMVPYGVSGRTTTSIVVEYSSVQSDPLAYNVVPAMPGIYTLNQQGNGPGAVLNQDGVTVNSVNTPAARGSIIAVYMTGEGQTSPAGVDGAVIPAVVSALKTPLAKVTATIAGVPAEVVYYGSAPGLISGVMQVNVHVPATLAPGGQVPLVISVGAAPSQAGVTIAIQ